MTAAGTHAVVEEFATTGLLLAGGRSRRFGMDKARVLVDGKPMIERVASVLRTVVDGPLLVSIGAAGEAGGGVSGDVRYVRDAVVDAGPLAGLLAGLAAAETPWIFAVACDLPFMTSEALRELMAARAPDVDAVVARTPDGRLHPLCACYHRRVRSVVDSHLADGRLAVHAMLDALETVRLVDLPTGPLRNVNRPTDLPPDPHDTTAEPP